MCNNRKTTMKKYILINVLLVLTSVFSMNPVNNIRCDIRSGTRHRPASQQVLSIQEERTTFDRISPARHHIIPYATLRRFFNKLLDNPDHFKHLLDHVLYEAGSNLGITNSMQVTNLRRYQLGDQPIILQNVESAVKRVQELYVWLPFNIYIGPRPDSRSDDPRDNFDATAHVIIGELRSNELQRIHREMLQYAAGNTADATAIINSMGNLVRTTQQPYGFNPDQWRIHRTSRRYAVASRNIISDRNYRQLDFNDYCGEDGIQAFWRYNPPEFYPPRRRA